LTTVEVYVDMVRRRPQPRILLIAALAGLLGHSPINPQPVLVDTCPVFRYLGNNPREIANSTWAHRPSVSPVLGWSGSSQASSRCRRSQLEPASLSTTLGPTWGCRPTLSSLGSPDASKGFPFAAAVLENLARHFPNMAPREFGGVVFLPGTRDEAGPTTLSHEAVHADISNLLRQVGAVSLTLGAGGTLVRIGAGLLPDDLNPEEELAYRAESPCDRSALTLRRATRAERKGPIAAFLRGIYGDK